MKISSRHLYLYRLNSVKKIWAKDVDLEIVSILIVPEALSVVKITHGEYKE